MGDDSDTYCSSYWQLLRMSAPIISELLNSHLGTPSSGSSLLSHLKGLPGSCLEIGLFSLEINVIAEEDISFLFDICLPKAATGHSVDKYFLDSRRRVYAFEILVWSLLDAVRSSPGIV